MTYRLESIDCERFVRIAFNGELTPENEFQVIKDIFSAIVESGHGSALVDRRNGPIDPSMMSNYEEARFISDLPAIHKYQVAVLLRAEDFEQSEFLESVAVVRGVNWKFFRSESAAIEWLDP